MSVFQQLFLHCCSDRYRTSSHTVHYSTSSDCVCSTTVSTTLLNTHCDLVTDKEEEKETGFLYQQDQRLV